MPRERSFRWRITLAFALLAAAVCGFFALAFVITFQTIEHQLFGQRLQAEAEWWAQHANEPSVALPPGRHFYQGTSIPAVLRELSPGYHDLEKGAYDYHVIVYDQGDRRYVLVSDESDFEHLEGLLYLALGIGGVSGIGVSIWLGRLMAGRIIVPLTQLAAAVTQSTGEQALPGLHADDEIGALARAFAARSQELQRFLQREQLFTGDVSHELRTPLTVILGAAELIGVLAKDNRALAAPVDRIKRATLDMTERVKAFLLLSRAPQTLDAPRISLTPIIERELERCQPLLAGKSVTCTWENPVDVFVNAQPELVSIAIGNLLRNACQYIEKGYVRVCLENNNQFIVQDSGPGMPAAVRDHLFERFVRGSDDRISGSGLGLSIVRRVVEHLGWHILVENPEEGGCRITLQFPLKDTKS